MRGNKMKYFLALVKKEFIEIRYSYKNLLMAAGLFILFLWIARADNNISPLIPIDWNNAYYVIAIFISSLLPSNFLMESILTDKANQTFERYFVSGNIKIIMFAKLSAMSILCIIPFFIFYAYFLFNGINIIDNIFIAFNTLLYFWIGLCIVTIITFPFNDEKSVAFACMPFIISIMGLLYLNDYIAVNYHPAFTFIITIICATVTTFVGYKSYKNTKYFLRI
jgi:hypothetical protein